MNTLPSNAKAVLKNEWKQLVKLLGPDAPTWAEYFDEFLVWEDEENDDVWHIANQDEGLSFTWDGKHWVEDDEMKLPNTLIAAKPLSPKEYVLAQLRFYLQNKDQLDNDQLKITKNSIEAYLSSQEFVDKLPQSVRIELRNIFGNEIRRNWGPPEMRLIKL